MRKLSVLIVREYNLYQWEAQLKVIAEIVGEPILFQQLLWERSIGISLYGSTI